MKITISKKQTPKKKKTMIFTPKKGGTINFKKKGKSKGMNFPKYA